eukprot:Tamp_09987.p1 GENE.Tamp_09987~~Tamp_09987.p1  ORF type:complete len:556 (-),score=45.57 Tamp_09987:430-2034(-)
MSSRCVGAHCAGKRLARILYVFVCICVHMLAQAGPATAFSTVQPLGARGHRLRPHPSSVSRARGRVRPSTASIKALTLDQNAASTALDYILLNFRILKAAIPAPISGYIATSPEGLTSQLAGLLALIFYLTTPPNVLGGLFDYAGAVSDKGGNPWLSTDIGRMGRALGKGTYGTAYEAFPTDDGLRKLRNGGRMSEGRAVVKKLIDLRQAETEAYFNRRLKRGGGGGYFATYLGGSQPDPEAEASRTQLDPRMLVWEYEGSRTLENFMTDPNFPFNLENYFYKRGQQPQELPPAVPDRLAEGDERRATEMLRKIMSDILRATKALHASGIVHRDIKPANILVSEVPTGQVLRVIDLGACADLRNGYNYQPESGVLDPRYGPPEQYIMPQSTPRPPPGILALLAAPFLWQTQCPDLFDSYTAGMTLLQMGVPQLRGLGGTKLVNSQLKSLDNDVEAWRERFGNSLDFSLLDRQNGAGWDLVCKLLAPKRKRISASAALAHRFFRPDGLSAVGVQPSGSKTLTKAGSTTLPRTARR